MKNKLFLATIAATMTVPAIVAPVQAETEFTGFTDVPKTHPYYDVIMEMYEMDIIKGYTDNTFRPSELISRMHVASLIDRATELEPVRDGVEFKDVPKTHPYYNVIQKLQRAGVVDGSGNGNFGPNDSLTRVQMAKILTLAFDLEVKAEYDFPDVPESHWGNKYVRALYSNGITFGDGGKFNPNQPVSRAHYAAFLHRLLNLDEDFVAPPIEQPKPEKPEVKPDPKPEPEKPEVKPDPKPEPEPEKPEVKPEPEKPAKPGDIIAEKDVVKPSGWTPEKLKQNREKAIEASKFRPGAVGSFGISNNSLERIRTESYKAYITGKLKDINSTHTYEDWVKAVNHAVKTGEVYTAPDNSYSVYAEYTQEMESYKPLVYKKITIIYLAA